MHCTKIPGHNGNLLVVLDPGHHLSRQGDGGEKVGPLKISGTLHARLPSKRPQKIVDALIDGRASPSRKGHHLVGVLAVHVGAVDREQHRNHQGYPEQAHVRIMNPDGSDQVKACRNILG
jgi:hypothetical protein